MRITYGLGLCSVLAPLPANASEAASLEQSYVKARQALADSPTLDAIRIPSAASVPGPKGPGLGPCLQEDSTPRFEPILKPDWLNLHFSPAESEALYRRFYHCGQPRIPHRWTPQLDGTALAVMIHGNKPYPIGVSARFLKKTIAHIEYIIERGHARHLYFIDFDHGHLELPKELFQVHYQKLWEEDRWSELMEVVLEDPGLRILYHSQELIRPTILPRELLGFYEDTPRVVPMDILTPSEWATARGEVQRLSDISFEAHPRGAFTLSNGTRFDITFENEGWAAQLPRIGVLIDPAGQSQPSP